MCTNGGPQSGLGPYVRTVKTKSGATAVQVVYLPRRGLAISGRHLAHDLLRRVLLPRSHVDVEPSLPAARAARLSNDLDQLVGKLIKTCM